MRENEKKWYKNEKKWYKNEKKWRVGCGDRPS